MIPSKLEVVNRDNESVYYHMHNESVTAVIHGKRAHSVVLNDHVYETYGRAGRTRNSEPNLLRSRSTRCSYDLFLRT